MSAKSIVGFRVRIPGQKEDLEIVLANGGNIKAGRERQPNGQWQANAVRFAPMAMKGGVSMLLVGNWILPMNTESSEKNDPVLREILKSLKHRPLREGQYQVNQTVHTLQMMVDRPDVKLFVLHRGDLNVNPDFASL